MAEDSDLDRTEPATPRRIEEARAKGQVPRSQELTTFAVLLAGGGGVVFLGATVIERLGGLMRAGLVFDRRIIVDPAIALARFFDAALAALLALAPLFALLVVIALAAPMLLGGFLFSTDAIAPQFRRINPAAGLSRLFSLHGVIELAKALVKTLVIGSVAAWALWHVREDLLALGAQDLGSGIHHLGRLMSFVFFSVVGGMLLIVAIDVPFQLWNYHRRLRMTREEVRREAREQEGNPQVKARIRALRREAARKRMMQEVPKASVVVTNPTRYAVALSYREGSAGAPRVVAKGAALVAERIRELAQEHGVPILTAPPLARALYAHADLGDEIPAALYAAVAEVLAYVYSLRRQQDFGGARPEPPSDLPVPPDLDPGSEA